MKSTRIQATQIHRVQYECIVGCVLNDRRVFELFGYVQSVAQLCDQNEPNGDLFLKAQVNVFFVVDANLERTLRVKQAMTILGILDHFYMDQLGYELASIRAQLDEV